MGNFTSVNGIVRVAAIPATVVATLAAAGGAATQAPALMYTAAAAAAVGMGCLTAIEYFKRRAGGACETAGVNDQYREMVEGFIANLQSASEVSHDGFRAGVVRQLKIIVGQSERLACRCLRWDAESFPHEFDVQVTEAKEIFVSLTPREAAAFHVSLMETLVEKQRSNVPVTIIYVLTDMSAMTPEIESFMKADLEANFCVKKMSLKVPRFQQPNGTQLNFIAITREDSETKGPTLVTFYTDDHGCAWGEFMFSSPQVFDLYVDLEVQLRRLSSPVQIAKAVAGNLQPPAVPAECEGSVPENHPTSHASAVGINRISPILNGSH